MSEKTIQFPLQVRPADGEPRPTCAWMLAGADPAGWLAETGRWGVPTAAIQLFVLPTSIRNIRPAGVLAVLLQDSVAGASPPALAYGRVAEKLFLPVDCELFPAVADAELRDLLPGHLYVFHPTIGLVGFEPQDAKSVHDLLAPPARKAVNWALAHPGVAGLPRLRSVKAPPPPDVETLLNQAGDDINSEPTQDAPPSPNDSVSGPLGKAGLRAAQGALWAMDKIDRGLAGLAGGKAGAAGRGGSGGWLSNAMKRVSAKLEATRHREIARLMSLLKTNPDHGLRYALPMNGPAHRGLARSGNRLTPRNVDFNVRRLGGGGPADLWEMPDDYRTQLLRLYREAAQREVALGRFRRAAYIHAELLGDYHAAANVLVQGRHYREAAVLYKDHLRIPREAARCLEKGGLLPEAIAIYQELGEFETAGDLHARLGDTAAANRAFRQAVEKYVGGGDLLRAATVLEDVNKLNAPDEALDLLWSGWPGSGHAGECLKRRFALLGRLGRHEISNQDVTRLRDEPYPIAHSKSLIDSLVTLSQTYPDAALRARSADTVRVVAARVLPKAEPDDWAPITNAVAALRPQDRLLRRDVGRYCTGRRAQVQARPRRAAGSVARKIEIVRSFSLPAEANWTTFAAADGLFYAAGYAWRDKRPTLFYHDWRDSRTQLTWPGPTSGAKPLFLAPGPIRLAMTLIGAMGLGRLAPMKASGTRGLVAGLPDFIPIPVYGVAYDRQSQIWTLSAQAGEPVLSCYDSRGSLVETLPLDLSAEHKWALGETGAMLLPREDGIWMAIGEGLVRPGELSQYQADMGQRIVSISGSIPHSVPRVAVTLAEGGRVYWPGKTVDYEEFGQGLIEPVGTITNDGSLIAVARGEGRIYQPRDRKHTLRFTFDGPSEPPLAVMQAHDIGHFAVAAATTVYLYAIPRT